MLDITTFDARQGGNVLYKALAHPLAAEAIARLYQQLSTRGSVALFDPEDVAGALSVMHPDLPPLDGLYVQDVMAVGRVRAGHEGRALVDLPRSTAATVLVAAFDAERIVARIRHLVPNGAEIATLDAGRIPAAMLTNKRRYLDRLNFATNYAFFREENGLSTRLVTANYWAGYGAREVRLWLRLFDAAGRTLAEWEETVPPGAGGIAIDSADVRARFGLPEFTGQLFVHAIGAAGHDVVKYALDTYGAGNDASLSCTHDANAWPSDRYAGVPAPDAGERVVLWVQNSHAVPIPPGGVALDRMGAEQPVALDRPVGPYATVALDVAELLPGLRWPAQIEVRAGRHFVRPRYEVVRDGRTRIAHANVERADLTPDHNIPNLPAPMGRGYLLPVPVMPREKFRTLIQPTPMAVRQTTLPIRLDIFSADGERVAEHFLGCLPRNHDVAVDIDTLLPDGALTDGGHVDLVYDFRDGGEADGWLHTLVRAEHRTTGHIAESSFGAHIYNVAMTYRDEPQSYSGPPPGLSTRLFLKVGQGSAHSFSALIYASSAAWHPLSETALLLHDSDGAVIAEETIRIACSGSAMVFPHRIFGHARIAQAGPRGYVLIRDVTCRLFGYHGLMEDSGRFSMDHMFGF
ncbi:MAG TPA: hypothetical protein VHS58_06200 [Acetobacteraceae bacterium]|jgi:hypothetical protein|nr:hypothetical protein [Acetobacteraceae bacterium]